MIHLLASLLLPAVLCQEPQARPQGPLSLDTFCLQPLRWQALRGAPPPFRTLLDRNDGQDLLRDDGLQPSFDGDRAIEWLHLLHPKECERETTSLRCEGDNLVLQADSTLLPKMLQDLQAVQQILTQPIELEAALYDFAGGLVPDTVLNGEALRRAIGERKPLWTTTRRARSGGQIDLGRERWTSYVHGVQAEVAQKVTATCPVIQQFFSGIRVSIVPHLLSGSDDVVLHCQFAIGQPREVKIQPTGFQGQPTLDIPTLELNTGACSGRVPSGGALLIALTGSDAGGSRLLLTVSARLPAAKPEARVGDMLLLPISAFTSSALSVPTSPPRFDAQVEQNRNDQEPQQGYGCFEAEALLDMLKAAGGGAFEIEGSYLQPLGRCWLMLHADSAALTQVEAALQALETRFLLNASFRLDAQLREAATPGTFAALAEGGATSTLHTVALPTLLGRHVTCCRGIETTATTGIGIEIAQEAEVQIPSMSHQTTGLWCTAVLAPAPGGAHLQLLAALNLQDPTPQRQFESGGVMVLLRPETTRVAFGEPVANGKDAGLGEGPRYSLDGRSYRSNLVARVTAAR